MGWASGPNGEYALVSVEQWDTLHDALDAGDLDQARELLLSWRPSSWPELNGQVSER